MYYTKCLKKELFELNNTIIPKTSPKYDKLYKIEYIINKKTI